MRVVIGSVVPVLTPILRSMVARYFGQRAAGRRPGDQRRHADTVRAARRSRRRSDRNSIAAYEQYGPAHPAAADHRRLRHRDDVRCGHGEGRVPRRRHLSRRPQIAADALFQRAARLPRVDVRKPARVIGHTTVGAIESGLFYGYVGMVEGLDDGG